MRVSFLFLTLILCACGGSGSGGAEVRSIDNPITEPPAAAGFCAETDFLGSWNTGYSSDADLTINEDCSFRVNQCGTTYEVLGTPDFSTNISPVTFRVRNYDFIQDGCLRPSVGDFQCNFKRFYDAGLEKDVFIIECADDNFYRTPVNLSWFRN